MGSHVSEGTRFHGREVMGREMTGSRKMWVMRV